MKKTWTQIKRDLWDESLAGQPVCKICQAKGATQLHHGVYPKGVLKGRKWHKILDHKCNAIEICDDCHEYLPENARKVCYDINHQRYEKEFIDWMNAVQSLLRLEDNYE